MLHKYEREVKKMLNNMFIVMENENKFVYLN